MQAAALKIINIQVKKEMQRVTWITSVQDTMKV